MSARRTTGGRRRSRSGALRPAGRTVVFTATGLCILALWEILGRTVLPSFMARPLGVLRAIPAVLTASPSLGLTMQTTFWQDLGATLGAIVEGMVVGTAAGAPQSFHQNAAFVYVLALALFAIGTRALVIAARRGFAAWDGG